MYIFRGPVLSLPTWRRRAEAVGQKKKIGCRLETDTRGGQAARVSKVAGFSGRGGSGLAGRRALPRRGGGGNGRQCRAGGQGGGHQGNRERAAWAGVVRGGIVRAKGAGCERALRVGGWRPRKGAAALAPLGHSRLPRTPACPHEAAWHSLPPPPPWRQASSATKRVSSTQGREQHPRQGAAPAKKEGDANIYKHPPGARQESQSAGPVRRLAPPPPPPMLSAASTNFLRMSYASSASA